MLYLRNTKTNKLHVYDRSLLELGHYQEYEDDPQDPPRKTKDISFYVSAIGIGDAVCALYAACGVADQGFNVTLHTRHVDWLSVAEHPNVSICQESDYSADANLDYAGQLRAGRDKSFGSRPNWYIKNIGRYYEIPVCQAARPAKVKSFNRSQKIAVLAPSSIWPVRSWSENRWTDMSNLLTDHGYLVVVIGSGKDKDLLDRIPSSQVYWNRPVAEILELIGSATILFGNDSGMVHVAGLLGTPAVAVLGPTTRDFIFDCGESVVGISSDMPCTGCYWQRDHGWDDRCIKNCESLQSVKPEQVLQLGESHVHEKQAHGQDSGLRREAAGVGLRTGRRRAKAKETN
jgi:ADP-heptose:LPS heptosyltransferase